ncbi:MAG: response regulator [Leptolyngbyaceae cyanobacterium]
MSKISILVIDDEADNFDVIESALPDQTYQLNYIDSGQEAIDSLDVFQPDLILLDLKMPEIDGIQVCKQIRSIPKWQPIPIIMITALTDKKDLARCLKAGANDFISKPFNYLELNARVNSMLRIKQQHDGLKTLLKFREDMVYMLVHDLRNRLTEILLGLEFQKAKVPLDREELAQIQSSANALQGLISDLLKVALLESDKIRLTFTEANIDQLIQSVVSSFEAIAAQKQQSILCELPQVSEQKVSIDTTMMCRVIDNLLSNAIKFSPCDSQIFVRALFMESNHLKIQVIDSGPGVPNSLKQKIFEKYEIGILAPGIPQIGLGLAFSKMVIEAHGGRIRVKDNQPKGAIFEITLPARF